MKIESGTTTGIVFNKLANHTASFGHDSASALIDTLQIEGNAFTGILQGVKSIQYNGATYEFAQTILTTYGDRSIFYRRFANGLWSPWVWTGFNSQFGVDKWDILEYKNQMCLMFIKNNLDLVVAYSQDLISWNQSSVLATNCGQCSATAFKDFIYFFVIENLNYKVGYTDFDIIFKTAFVPVNYYQISIRVAFNQILLLDVSPISSHVQTWDGNSIFGIWQNLGFTSDSWVNIAFIFSKVYLTYRNNITGYPIIAQLLPNLTITGTTNIQTQYTDAVYTSLMIYKSEIYVGILQNDKYKYTIASSINFPIFTKSKIVDTNFIEIVPTVIVKSDKELNQILYVPITKNLSRYYRFIIKKYIRGETQHYYELDLWTYFNQDALVLESQTYNNHSFLNAS
jgi:hypothetical protein